MLNSAIPATNFAPSTLDIVWLIFVLVPVLSFVSDLLLSGFPFFPLTTLTSHTVNLTPTQVIAYACSMRNSLTLWDFMRRWMSTRRTGRAANRFATWAVVPVGRATLVVEEGWRAPSRPKTSLEELGGWYVLVLVLVFVFWC